MTLTIRRHLAYLSCPLTGLSQDEFETHHKYYEQIGVVLEAAGFDAYLPHIAGDPKLNPHLTPQQIRIIDKTAVSQSSLMVIYMGKTSHGAGQENEMAEIQSMPHIFLADGDNTLSRLPLGGDHLFRTIYSETWEASLDSLARALADLKAAQPNWMPEVLKL